MMTADTPAMTNKFHITPALLLALLLFWAPVIVFSLIAGEVLERKPLAVDVSILNAIHAHANPFLDKVSLFFTTLGSALYMIPITIAIISVLLYAKQRVNAMIVAFGAGGAAVANVIIKLIFHRQRPDLWPRIVNETSYSFPSGHAMASSALVFCLIAALWHTRYRWVAILAGGTVMLLIGLSRLYFGVHYPSDVIAGWCASLVWVLLVVRLLRHKIKL